MWYRVQEDPEIHGPTCLCPKVKGKEEIIEIVVYIQYQNPVQKLSQLLVVPEALLVLLTIDSAIIFVCPEIWNVFHSCLLICFYYTWQRELRGYESFTLM